MINEIVSETISQVNEITHTLCGWTINDIVIETRHRGIMRSCTGCG